MQYHHPSHKHHSHPKEYISHEEIPAEDLVPSLTLQGINNNMQNMNNKPQSYDSRRKTYRNEEMEETPEKEGSEFSMSYSPSNPTRTNTLSHRANSRNFPGKKGPQASHGSIDFPKARDYKMEDQIHIMNSDENESQMHDLESKRDCVYEALEYARGQIRNFDEEMKMVGKKHSTLVGEFEKNYKTIENETEQYYNEILEKWKEVVREKISRYRNNYEGMIQEQEQEIEQLKEVISKVEEQNAGLNKRNEELENERDGILQKFEDEYERVERQKSDTIKSLNDTYKEQIETLEKENDELASDLKNTQMRLKSAEERTWKEIKNIERFNHSLKENNETLKSEVRKLRDELANNAVSSTLDALCSKVELQADFDKQIKMTKRHESTIEELNQVISKLTLDLQSMQENYESYKTESTEKYRALEEKSHKLKVMLHLERPKKNSRSTTPTETLRESRVQESERSPSHNQTSRLLEEEKSRLDVSTIVTPQYPPLAPLLEQLEEGYKKKEKLGTQIKAWISDFRRKEKKMPTDQDKLPIKDLYDQHRAVRKQIETAKENIMVREPSTANTVAQNNNNVSILQTEPDERGMKSKSVSPKRAQMLRMRMNPNVSNISINASFDGSATGNLNTSTNDQSMLQANSFYHSSGLPMAMPNDVVKLKSEYRNLREELHQFRMQTATKFEESDMVNQMKNEILAVQRDKKFLKDKVASLTKSLKGIQAGVDTSMIGGGDDMGRKSIDTERFRMRAENENKLKDVEERYSIEMENLKQEYKQQIAGIIKAKDILISTTTQENEELKEENNKLIREFKMNNQEFSKLKAQFMELEQEVEDLKNIKAHLEARIRTEIAQRKKLHNIVEDMKGKVRVFCRVRPMIKSEIDKGCRSVATLIDDFNMNLETKNGPKVFPYDSCFGPQATQDQIFEDTKRLIQSAIDGYNVCIFAYGQTGSGKTYTMYGTKERPGITPRAIEELYHVLGQMESFCDIKVSCHMVEVYMDQLIDLLLNKENKKPSQNLEIKEDSKGMVYIQNVTTKPAMTKDDLSRLIKTGMMNRKTSGTAMNDASSRSHLIVNIIIEINNLHTNQRTIGKLSLVDLAGSERVSKSHTNPQQLNEARAINKSLTALGDVISALSSRVWGEKDKFVPYRNNKLTMLMKDCLGGTAKTLMFVNVSPADYNQEESYISLSYATRVKLITNETVKNIETKEFARMKEHLKSITEERDNFKQILVQNGIPLTRSQLGSLQNTPSKFEGDESKFDEGPLYQMPVNDSFKFSV